MATIIYLLVFLAFCIMTMGALGILVFVAICGGYYLLLCGLGQVFQRKQPPE